MKKLLIISLLASNTLCMKKTSSLLREMSEAYTEAEKIINQPNPNPKYMNQEERAQALDQLHRIQEASKKLSIILNDTDGWVTQESEK